MKFKERFKHILNDNQSNIDVYLHATALQIETFANGRQVRQIHAGNLEGNRIRIEARHFVLASGIENARLMLASTDSCGRGLGNETDCVGRYYMGHVHFLSGLLVGQSPHRKLDLYGLELDWENDEDERTLSCGLQISSAAQREHRLLNYATFLAPLPSICPGTFPHIHKAARGFQTGRLRWKQQKDRWLRRILGKFRPRPEMFSHDPSMPRIYALRNWVEQAPDPRNRITLSNNVDQFGIPKLRMSWTLGPLERQTITKAQSLLQAYFRDHGIGQLTSDLPPHDSPWPEHLCRTSHFMGSTRLSQSPADGVVNRDCRVHSVKNLYVAGGSVLPTSGVGMVTCNLIALALRLGDHLKQQFSTTELVNGTLPSRNNMAESLAQH